MATAPVEASLVFTDNFTSRMALAAQAAKSMGDALALARATWEPHDWSTF